MSPSSPGAPDPSAAPAARPALTAGASCAVHRTVTAVEVCARCGNFLCGECVELVGADDVPTCGTCLQFVAAGGSSRRSRWALGLGLLGLLNGMVPLLLVPASIAALWLGLQERRAIDRGESADAGRTLARAGLWLGVVGLVAQLGLIVFVLAIALGHLGHRH